MTSQNNLTKALQDLADIKTTQNIDRIAKQNLINQAQNSITLAVLNYEQMVRGPTVTDIRSAQNSIASANTSLSKSYLSLKDYQIIAPFDGVIEDIPWKI